MYVDRVKPKVKIKRKSKAAKPKAAQQREEYGKLSVPARKQQLASKGVLAPGYGKVVRKEHKRRVVQLKKDPDAQLRLAKRELVRAVAAIPAPKKLERVKGGGVLEDIGEALGDAAEVAAALASIPAVVARRPREAVKVVRKVARNAPGDAAELIVTAPSSIAKLASTAAHDPEKLPAMLAEPYIEMAKNPGEFITERPVTAALMAQPAVRVPGRAAGKVARVAGKQTLKRPDSTLPGTGLREQRVGSRDIVVRAVQQRRDAKTPAPVMTERQIRRRVDEFYGAGQKHVQRTTAAANRQVRKRKLKGEDAESHVSGAIGAARDRLDERFAKEFGATWDRLPSGAIVKPKRATEGVLYPTRADADAIAARLPFDASVKEVGGKWAVLPAVAAQRLHKHEVVGTSPALPAKLMRVTRRQFTKTVLPFSPKWLTGQAVEAGMRAFLGSANPVSSIRTRRVVAELERREPGSGKKLLERTAPGGLASLAHREVSHRTLADEFAGTELAKVARSLTHVGAKPGPKQVRGVFNALTGFVFNTLNGRIIEGPTQRAMVGKALKASPLMERRVIGLTDKAIKEAADGLTGTEAQVMLGREVQAMYGKYANFSPGLRSWVMHWSPFVAWYLNVGRFLTRVLPVDHPVHAALIADMSAATEEWRKAAGLSLHGDDRVSSHLLGSYPAGPDGDQFKRLGRYTPFGVGEDVAGSLSGLLLPQFDSALMALRGLDWTGEPLNGKYEEEANQGQRFVAAANALIESMVPGVAIGRDLTDREDDETVGDAANQRFNPLAPTRPREPAGTNSGLVRLKPVRVKPMRLVRKPK